MQYFKQTLTFMIHFLSKTLNREHRAAKLLEKRRPFSQGQLDEDDQFSDLNANHIPKSSIEIVDDTFGRFRLKEMLHFFRVKFP